MAETQTVTKTIAVTEAPETPPPAPSVQPDHPVQASPPPLSLSEFQKRPGQGGISGGATFSSALDALEANRVRSFLTMLAVIIGVSAVIAVVTLTQGVNKSVNDSFSGLGTNILTILPGASSSTGGARSAAGSSQTLTRADADALTKVPYVVDASPVIGANGQLVYQNSNWNTRVSGVYPSYQTIENWQLAEGNWFTDQDEQIGKQVIVLGATVASDLFPFDDPIGKTITVGTVPFQVIGVLQTKGSQGASNADDVAYVPFTSAYKYLNTSAYVSQIQVEVDSTSDITRAQFAITSLLRTRHNLSGPDPSLFQSNTTTQRSSLLGGNRGPGGGGPGGANFNGGGANRGGAAGGGGTGATRGGAAGGGGYNGGGTGNTASRGTTGSQQGTGTRGANGRGSSFASDPANDFQIFSVENLIQSAQQSSTVLTYLLVGIAAISLAVGGIGIMNIMLVSVSERRREIGLRMAIGARRRDISNQFLVEALMLTAIGGVIGIILGLAGGWGLTTGLSVPFVLSVTPILIAFSISTVVGVIFGLYPALSAAKLDPIAALRVLE